MRYLLLGLGALAIFIFGFVSAIQVSFQPKSKTEVSQSLGSHTVDLEAGGEEKIKQTNPTSSDNQKIAREKTRVIRVIDGDTIEIETRQKVRYIGIDTPEIVHPQMGAECFGVEAARKNRELVEGKTIELEKDVSETDKYGRLLRYVYVGEIFVNDYLVRGGYSSASSYPPDIKYQDRLNHAESEARQNNRGLWAACGGKSIQITENSHLLGCFIKGNISASSGEKIYHMPGQRYYEKTVINEDMGERFFCSEEEAIAAGWRKSKQ